ncbi:unnamed protein product [Bursaphelenchus xylophilus]|uniref:(pine wood nematode) hypothetical protein n=1 Tax=Bursaphelenchus xylophilus TaxID=6326 RepID=A0A1I7S086_BURXY|nr:unnamed protein product [Bursaphelenchus xylophilus]CAG9108948.1 unnamed protein product [Bursaphelenchus xylophilus]
MAKRLNNHSTVCLLQHAASQLHVFSPEVGDQPSHIYSIVMENEKKLELDEKNLFFRLIMASPSALGSFRGHVSGVDKTFLVFQRLATYIQYGSRIKINFTRSVFLKFFVHFTKPLITEIKFYDTHFFRRHIMDICDSLVEDECFDKNTWLRFVELHNDNAYGTLQEVLREHIRKIEIDEEFSTYLSKSGEYDEVIINSKTAHELYYINSFFKIRTEKLVIPQVAWVRIFQDFENIPVNERLKTLELSFNTTDEEKDHQVAAETLKTVAPNLEDLTLTKLTGITVETELDVDKIKAELEKVITYLREKSVNQIYGKLNLKSLSFASQVYVQSNNESIPNLDRFVSQLNLKKIGAEKNYNTYTLATPVPDFKFVLYSCNTEYYPFKVANVVAI